jgi:transposase-like protein
MDVLLRTQRDLASAEAFFIRATARRQTVPTEVVTDKHQAYVGAVRKHASEAMHVRTGLHRASGQTTKAIKRSHRSSVRIFLSKSACARCAGCTRSPRGSAC